MWTALYRTHGKALPVQSEADAKGGARVMQANTFVPQIWADALVAYHLSRANAWHRTLQLGDKLEDWARELAQTELNYALLMLSGLGKHAVLRDGVYQLELML